MFCMSMGTSSQVIRSQDTLEDYGSYAVPHLVSILDTAPSAKIRDLAVRILSQNARLRLINEYGESLDEETKRRNREIDR